jgi:hypothetical protein
MVPALRCGRTRHLSVWGEEPRDIMDSVGQCLSVDEMVRMCVRAMWPLYPGVFMSLLCMWQTVSCAARPLREGRP